MEKEKVFPVFLYEVLSRIPFPPVTQLLLKICQKKKLKLFPKLRNYTVELLVSSAVRIAVSKVCLRKLVTVKGHLIFEFLSPSFSKPGPVY